MNYAIDAVTMHFECKCRLDLTDRAVKGDLIAAIGDPNVGKSLAVQPCGDFRNIIEAKAETLAELRGGQILMIVRRLSVSEFRDETIQVLLLCCRRAEGQGRSLDQSAIVGAAEIEFPSCQPVNIPPQRNFGPSCQIAGNPVWHDRITDLG